MLWHSLSYSEPFPRVLPEVSMNCNWLFFLKKIQNIFSPSGSPFLYRIQSLGPTSGDTQPTALGCPDTQINLSHTHTVTASQSWNTSHATQVSLFPSRSHEEISHTPKNTGSTPSCLHLSFCRFQALHMFYRPPWCEGERNASSTYTLR